MTATTRAVVAVVVLTIVAAAAGVWVGMSMGGQRSHHASTLDEILHHELGLTSDQEQRIAALEARFAQERTELEAQMRAANRELALALKFEHSYGDNAKAAIAHFHAAMAKLQELTVLHILDMRAVLTPEQAEQFDKTVRDSLAADPP